MTDSSRPQSVFLPHSVREIRDHRVLKGGGIPGRPGRFPDETTSSAGGLEECLGDVSCRDLSWGSMNFQVKQSGEVGGGERGCKWGVLSKLGRRRAGVLGTGDQTQTSGLG